jgi:hypothetical protein
MQVVELFRTSTTPFVVDAHICCSIVWLSQTCAQNWRSLGTNWHSYWDPQQPRKMRGALALNLMNSASVHA